MKVLIACFSVILLISCRSERVDQSDIWKGDCSLERLEYQEITDTIHRTKNGGIEGGVAANGKLIYSDKINVDSVKAYLNAGNKVFISQTTLRTVKVSQDFYEKYTTRRESLCQVLAAMKKSNNFGRESKKRAETMYLDIVEMNSGLGDVKKKNG